MTATPNTPDTPQSNTEIVRDGKIEAWRDIAVRRIVESLVPPIIENGIAHRHPDQLQAEERLRSLTREYAHKLGGKVYANDI